MLNIASVSVSSCVVVFVLIVFVRSVYCSQYCQCLCFLVCCGVCLYSFVLCIVLNIASVSVSSFVVVFVCIRSFCVLFSRLPVSLFPRVLWCLFVFVRSVYRTQYCQCLCFLVCCGVCLYSFVLCIVLNIASVSVSSCVVVFVLYSFVLCIVLNIASVSVSLCVVVFVLIVFVRSVYCSQYCQCLCFLVCCGVCFNCIRSFCVLFSILPVSLFPRVLWCLIVFVRSVYCSQYCQCLCFLVCCGVCLYSFVLCIVLNIASVSFSSCVVVFVCIRSFCVLFSILPVSLFPRVLWCLYCIRSFCVLFSILPVSLFPRVLWCFFVFVRSVYCSQYCQCLCFLVCCGVCLYSFVLCIVLNIASVSVSSCVVVFVCIRSFCVLFSILPVSLFPRVLWCLF